MIEDDLKRLNRSRRVVGEGDNDEEEEEVEGAIEEMEQSRSEGMKGTSRM